MPVVKFEETTESSWIKFDYRPRLWGRWREKLTFSLDELIVEIALDLVGVVEQQQQNVAAEE